MTIDAEYVIVNLLTVLFGNRTARPVDRGLMSHVVRGRQHTPGCPFGMALRPGDGERGGSDCSDRCKAAWEAFELAVYWLEDHASPEQLALTAEAAR